MKRIPVELKKLLAKYDARIQKAFFEAIRKQQNAVRIATVIDALKANDLNAAYRAVRIDEAYFVGVKRAIGDAYWAGGQTVSAKISPKSLNHSVLEFDGTKPRAEAWVKTQTARLVTNVVDEQRGLVRFVIQEGLRTGSSPSSVALDIVGRINRATGLREGGFVGLRPQTAQSVLDMRRDMKTIEGMRKYMNRPLRDRRFDNTILKAIENKTVLSKNMIQKLSTRYEAKALAYRGKVIAENETAIAIDAGRKEGYQQLIDDGAIDADQLTKTWHQTPTSKPRPDHTEMDGQTIQQSENFNLPDGAVMTQTHDPAGGAANNIGCQCWTSYTVAAKGA